MKRLVPILASILLVASCGDDDAATTTTAAATTSATTTTAAVTTTPATLPPTTAATTTTTAPTTTTVPEPVFGFFPDGLGLVDFGATPDEVVAALSPWFGAPTKDTGWIAEPLCPAPTYRLSGFGPVLFDFTVIFTTAEWFLPAGNGHFFGYSYGGATGTPTGPPALTAGTTKADVLALYPDATFGVHPLIDSAYQFVVDPPGPEYLSGALNGNDPGSTVTGIRGGGACGE